MTGHYAQPPDADILAYARRAAPAAWGITPDTPAVIVERQGNAWIVEFALDEGRTEQLRVTIAPEGSKP